MSSDKLESSNVSFTFSEGPNRPSELWGCELNKECKKYVLETEDDLYEHLLGLWTICLGAEAEDEINVITVEVQHIQGKPVTIASLRPSILPMINVSGLEFTPPVTFTLSSGSGPVYISGMHLTCSSIRSTKSSVYCMVYSIFLLCALFPSFLVEDNLEEEGEEDDLS